MVESIIKKKFKALNRRLTRIYIVLNNTSDPRKVLQSVEGLNSKDALLNMVDTMIVTYPVPGGGGQ